MRMRVKENLLEWRDYFFRSQFLGSFAEQCWTCTGLVSVALPGTRTLMVHGVVIHRRTRGDSLSETSFLFGRVHWLPSSIGSVAPSGPDILAPSATATTSDLPS